LFLKINKNLLQIIFKCSVIFGWTVVCLDMLPNISK
jgi:hypothetical protein